MPNIRRGVYVRTGQAPLVPMMIYQEAADTYFRAFLPLARFAGVIALAFNTFFFYQPAELILNLSWTVLVNFFGVTMRTSAAVLPMASELRADGTTSTSTGFRGIRQHGVRFLLATTPLAILNGLLIFTWIGIALAVFLTVRLALFGPAIIVEENDVTDAYIRSWELAGTGWLRAGAILLGALSPFVIFATILAIITPPVSIMFLLIIAAEAATVPFVAIVVLLLFDDYRQTQEGVNTEAGE